METTLIDIEPLCGLPVTLDPEACKLEFRDGMNQPDFYHRTGADLESVYIADLTDEDRARKLYSVSSSLWLDGEESIWRDAKVTYGLVLFAPGDIGGEYIKSSGQFHPILPGHFSAAASWRALDVLCHQAIQPYLPGSLVHHPLSLPKRY